jgi:hypothetical protein
VKRTNRWRNGASAAQGLAALCALGAVTGFARPANAQKVFIGSANGWRQMIDHPEQWTYVRQNADGFYVNFIELLHADTPAMAKLSALFTHRNAYYESDSRYNGLGGFPDNGQFSRALQAREMSNLLDGGFDVPYTSLNYGYDDPKGEDLKHQGLPPGKTRPCFAQYGPWNFSGDLMKNAGTNARVRSEIAHADGATTDGPLSLWQSDQGHMRAGSYSLVKYAHSLHKPAAVMVSPYNLKPRTQWLQVAQDCVRQHEDAGAKPDIWMVFEYATDTPTLPETVDGKPADTITGMAFWLIHHVKDPQHWANIVLPADGKALDSTDIPVVRGGQAARGFSSREIQLNVRNDSSWMDLCPVVFADVQDPRGDWNVRFEVNGTDVTTAMRQGGLAFVGGLRLWPGDSRSLKVVMTARRAGAPPITVNVGLRPNRAADAPVHQMVTLRSSLAPQAPQVAAR